MAGRRKSVGTLLAFVTDAEILAVDHYVHGKIECWLIINHLYGARLACNKSNRHQRHNDQADKFVAVLGKSGSHSDDPRSCRCPW